MLKNTPKQYRRLTTEAVTSGFPLYSELILAFQNAILKKKPKPKTKQQLQYV